MAGSVIYYRFIVVIKPQRLISVHKKCGNLRECAEASLNMMDAKYAQLKYALLTYELFCQVMRDISGN